MLNLELATTRPRRVPLFQFRGIFLMPAYRFTTRENHARANHAPYCRPSLDVVIMHIVTTDEVTYSRNMP